MIGRTTRATKIYIVLITDRWDDLSMRIIFNREQTDSHLLDEASVSFPISLFNKRYVPLP